MKNLTTNKNNCSERAMEATASCDVARRSNEKVSV